MWPSFDNSQSNSLKSCKNIHLDVKNPLNFSCLYKKFHNCHHASKQDLVTKVAITSYRLSTIKEFPSVIKIFTFSITYQDLFGDFGNCST